MNVFQITFTAALVALVITGVILRIVRNPSRSRHRKYVDLGLPSGTLWANDNEIGLYQWDEANNIYFKDALPTPGQFRELIDNCRWEWDEHLKGMTVTGPNGRELFLPAPGYFTGRAHFDINLTGCYWTAAKASINPKSGRPAALSMTFWEGNRNPEYPCDSDYYLSVRLVKTQQRHA